jgi:hypothetical protein
MKVALILQPLFQTRILRLTNKLLRRYATHTLSIVGTSVTPLYLIFLLNGHVERVGELRLFLCVIAAVVTAATFLIE